ncbi:hypothetical protein [Scleromatobacter humisilvae]|nr:hypothetical protein [Scleromatobacter humisilvae]
MSQILKLLKSLREESPVAVVVLPIAAFVFITSSFGYVALTIANR